MKMLSLQNVTKNGLICIYVRDHCDCVDVMRQLLVLRDDIGWKSRLDFKTDKATLADETWCKYHSPKVDACGKVELLLNKPSKGNGKKKVEGKLVAVRVSRDASGLCKENNELHRVVACGVDEVGVIHYERTRCHHLDD
jgi:hypothetical protein